MMRCRYQFELATPDSGTEFIPNSDRLQEKKWHIWDLHRIDLNDKNLNMKT
jgi:hypothetical protein